MKQKSVRNFQSSMKWLFCLSLVFAVNFLHAAAPLSYEVTRDSSIAYNSISSSGNSVASWRNGVSTDDNLSNTIPIGFNFTYQGVSYSNILISNNGFITFNIGTTETGAGNVYNGNNQTFSLSGSNGSPSAIAPFYDDLRCNGNLFTQASLNASMKYSVTTGSNRVFTVEWISMQAYQQTSPNYNFQVKLYEGTNNIEFVYGSMQGFNGTSNSYFPSYTCGINGSVISATPLTGELLTQQIPNTRNFSATPSFGLSAVPKCYTRILFTPGTYTPYTTPVSTVVNNNPAGAISLPVNSSPCTSLCGTFYSSAGASATSGIPVCVGNPDDDIWFSFVATNPATTITVLSAGAYDAVVQLLNSSFSSLACKNDAVWLTETINTSSLTVGQTYYVRVYDFNAGFGAAGNGQFSICVSATPLPPSNDNCTSAVVLPVNTTMIAMNGTSTVGATASAGPTPCNGTVPDHDVWYSFTALTPIATIQVQGDPGFDPAIEFLSGTCGTTSMTILQCANNTSTGGLETVSASGLTPGTVYYLRIYNASGGAGIGSFTIGVASATPVCATTFSPINGTAHLSPGGITLSWNSVNNATGYDVYVDTINPPVKLKGSNISTTSLFSGALVQGKTYFWRVSPRNGAGVTTGCFINQFAPIQPYVGMNIKLFISGFYIGNKTMNAVIDPTNYPDITDSITVSLAQATSPYPILFSVKAALKTNGTARCLFPNEALLGNYFIVFNHRNSLETWSYKYLGFNSVDTTFDFTNARSSNANSFRLVSSPHLQQFTNDNAAPDAVTELDNIVQPVPPASSQNEEDNFIGEMNRTESEGLLMIDPFFNP